MRHRRRTLSKSERARAALYLARRIQGFAKFRISKRIAVYFANDGEISLNLIIARAIRTGKSCYLPTLCPLGRRKLWFTRYNPEERLYSNRLKILEPPQKFGVARIRAKDLDLILVPLVAFDLQGNRLGRGGGYYDHTLNFLIQRSYWRKPHIIGIAYDFQRVSNLPIQPWDVPMNFIITEKYIYSKRRSS